MEINIPENFSFVKECLKEAYHLTHRTIYNVCDGSMATVPYGFWDYAVYVGILGVFICAVIFLIKVIID